MEENSGGPFQGPHSSPVPTRPDVSSFPGTPVSGHRIPRSTGVDVDGYPTPTLCSSVDLSSVRPPRVSDFPRRTRQPPPQPDGPSVRPFEYPASSSVKLPTPDTTPATTRRSSPRDDPTPSVTVVPPPAPSCSTPTPSTRLPLSTATGPRPGPWTFSESFPPTQTLFQPPPPPP